MQSNKFSFFKNITPYYLLNNPIPEQHEELVEKIQPYQFTPCLATEMSKTGFNKIIKDEYYLKLNNYLLFEIIKEEKILPSEVVKEETLERIEELEEKLGKKLKKADKEAIKSDVIQKLLPRAFSKYKKTQVVFDFWQNLIYINTSSAKVAEDVLAFLRKTFESLPVIPLSFNSNLSLEMKGFLTNSENNNTLLSCFSIGDEFEVSENESSILCKNVSYSEEDIQNILNQKQNDILKMSFDYQDSLSFVLHNNCTIKKIKFSEEFKTTQKEETNGEEDHDARYSSDFILFSETIAKLFSQLIEQFNGIKSNK